MTETQVYRTTVLEVDGELAFEFPDDLAEKLNLQKGDNFDWLFYDDYVIMRKSGSNEDSNSE
jgi:hypothetical protein